MPALIWAHIHTTGPSGHIRYCLLPDPGTQAPKTSNFVDGAAATSPTTNERGVVRVHERHGYLQRSSLWCEVEVKRNGEGESVTLMMVAHMMCSEQRREVKERARGSSGTAHLGCGGFHTTRARMRGGTPLGALDICIAPPPLEAWGAVIVYCRLPQAIAAEQDSNTTVSHRTGVEPGSLS